MDVSIEKTWTIAELIFPVGSSRTDGKIFWSWMRRLQTSEITSAGPRLMALIVASESEFRYSQERKGEAPQIHGVIE